MKIAIIGATGLVGTKIRELIADRKLSFSEVILTASEHSLGKKLQVGEQYYKVISIEEALQEKPTIAFFSSGGDISTNWVKKFTAKGTYVIDMSSVYRMEKNIPLVVPEINADCITKNSKIIANPNCSTIQLAMILHPLHKRFYVNRVVVSTYQSVTGTGQNAVEQMQSERSGNNVKKVYPYQIDMNCLPQCDIFLDNSYTKEEMKVINETRKILNDYTIKLTCTAVRVPVIGGHSESVNIQFKKKYSLKEIYKILRKTEGVKVFDNVKKLEYPMPILANGKDEVFVGRIRKDESHKKGLNLWIVSDNIRKGAATNALQIAEYLQQNFF